MKGIERRVGADVDLDDLLPKEALEVAPVVALREPRRDDGARRSAAPAANASIAKMNALRDEYLLGFAKLGVVAQGAQPPGEGSVRESIRSSW